MKYHISGMHCAACENIVFNMVSEINGIRNIKVSSKNNTIEFENTNSNTSAVKVINNRLKDFGYSLSENNANDKAFSTEAYMTAFVVGVILVISYIILNDLGLLESINNFHINSENIGLGSILSFFTLGIIASLTSCALLIGGIIASLSRTWSLKSQNISIIKFHVGRILSFFIFGTILGIIGTFFQMSMTALSVVTIAVSLLMLIVGFQILRVPYFKFFKFSFLSFFLPKVLKTQRSEKLTPFLIGGMTFFVPCGFTLIAQSMAVITGNPITSGLLMLSFVLGTLPALLALSFTGYLLGKRSEISDAFSILASIAIILFALYSINSQLNILGLPSINNLVTDQRKDVFGLSLSSVSTIITTDKGQIQEATILAREFDYYPPLLKLKADIPTNLTIINEKVEGCARAMWLGSLYDKPIYLNEDGSQTVNFTPKKGSYKISCTMGMVSPIEVIVE